MMRSKRREYSLPPINDGAGYPNLPPPLPPLTYSIERPSLLRSVTHIPHSPHPPLLASITTEHGDYEEPPYPAPCLPHGARRQASTPASARPSLGGIGRSASTVNHHHQLQQSYRRRYQYQSSSSSATTHRSYHHHHHHSTSMGSLLTSRHHFPCDEHSTTATLDRLNAGLLSQQNRAREASCEFDDNRLRIVIGPPGLSEKYALHNGARTDKESCGGHSRTNCASSNVFYSGEHGGIYLNDDDDGRIEREERDDADSTDWHTGVVKATANTTSNHFQKIPSNANNSLHHSKMMRRRTAAGAALFRHGELPGKFPVNPSEDDMALDHLHHQAPPPFWRPTPNPFQSSDKPSIKARSRSQPQHHNANQNCRPDELPKPPRSRPYVYPSYAEQRAAITASRVSAVTCNGDDEESGNGGSPQAQCTCQQQKDAGSMVVIVPVQRADRYSIDSTETGCGSCSQDSGIRSSTHSNSSQSTATSAGTVHNVGDNGINGSKHPVAAKRRETRNDERIQCTSSMLLVEAVWDHVAMLADELAFAAGDIITVVDTQSAQSGLWYGVCRDRSGWFPAAYVRIKDPHDHYLLSQLLEHESAACGAGDDSGHSGDHAPTTAHNNSLSSAERDSDDSGSLRGSDDGGHTHQVDPLAESFPPPMRYLRRKIVQELMATERDYVQLLDNLVDGFAEQCRRRHELFNEERIRRVFGNLEELRQLHVKFLRDLEASHNGECTEMSCMARPFLRHGHCFGVYTEYCNNRPVSCAELAALSSQPQYYHFFEACRLLRGMPKLSLEGFLLTPVQRICRYPLQLMELLKATPAAHPDRRQLEQAHRTMRAVAAHINDSKRRLDGIQKIILWQRNVHAFRGPDLVDNNHRMLNSGEMYCRALVRGGGLGQSFSAGVSLQWAKTVHVYLFDQSVVLCKKDVLKKGALVFKERMSLQGTSVTDLNDGKDSTTGCQLKNSLKLSGPTREYVFTCPDPATKGLWLDALRSRPRPTPPSSAEKRLAIITLSGGGGS